jgi:hypothetical protein
MEPERRFSAVPILALAVMLPAVVLGVYVGGYFLRCEVIVLSRKCRVYPTSWEAKLFRPAATIESSFTGSTVSTHSVSHASDFD